MLFALSLASLEKRFLCFPCTPKGIPQLENVLAWKFLNSVEYLTPNTTVPILFGGGSVACGKWCSLENYDRLLKEIHMDKGRKVFQNGIPAPLLHWFSRAQVPVSKDVHAENPVWSFLKPHQQQSARFVEGIGGRAMNAGSMGTGKTVTTICNLYEAATQYNLETQLIVCPSSLRFNWKGEFQKFAPEMKTNILLKGTDPFVPQQINIVSYSLLRSMLSTKKKKCKKKKKKPSKKKPPPSPAPRRPKFDVIVLDESHYVKNATAQRTKVVTKLAREATRVILLSGTPSSRPVELFSQLKMIDPQLFQSFYPYTRSRPRVLNCKPEEFHFGARYCSPELVYVFGGRPILTFKGCVFPWELNLILRFFMTRKTLQDLPAREQLLPKIRERVILEPLPPRTLRKYKQELEKIEQYRATNQNQRADSVLMELTRTTCKDKLTRVNQFVRQLFESRENSKILLFAHHLVMLDNITEALRATKIKFIRIDGTTPARHRQKLVDQFSTDPTISGAVLSIKAAGTGLNFTVANHVIFAELLWSEKDHLQAEERCQRIGQTKQVLVQYLLLQDTTDDILWRSLSKKVSNSSAMLDNKNTFLGSRVKLVSSPNQTTLKRTTATTKETLQQPEKDQDDDDDDDEVIDWDPDPISTKRQRIN